jgi:hypothetical protein
MAPRCDYPSQTEQHWRVAGKFCASQDLLGQPEHDGPKISFFSGRSKEVERRAHRGCGVSFLEAGIPQDLMAIFGRDYIGRTGISRFRFILSSGVVCSPARCRLLRKG